MSTQSAKPAESPPPGGEWFWGEVGLQVLAASVGGPHFRADSLPMEEKSPFESLVSEFMDFLVNSRGEDTLQKAAMLRQMINDPSHPLRFQHDRLDSLTAELALFEAMDRLTSPSN